MTVARSTDGRLLTQAVEALFDPGSAAAGGSAAAIAAALAATVLANIARSGGDHGRAAQGAALGMRLARLAGGDAQVLAVARALLENAAEGGNATRDFDLGRALDEAVSAPLAIAEASADVAILAAELCPLTDPDLAPDAVSAAILASAAARAAAHLVEANLGVSAVDERAIRARAAAAAAEKAAAEAL